MCVQESELGDHEGKEFQNPWKKKMNRLKIQSPASKL